MCPGTCFHSSKPIASITFRRILTHFVARHDLKETDWHGKGKLYKGTSVGQIPLFLALFQEVFSPILCI